VAVDVSIPRKIILNSDGLERLLAFSMVDQTRIEEIMLGLHCGVIVLEDILLEDILLEDILLEDILLEDILHGRYVARCSNTEAS